MRVDVYAHYGTDDYLDLMVRLGKTANGTQPGTGAPTAERGPARG